MKNPLSFLCASLFTVSACVAGPAAPFEFADKGGDHLDVLHGGRVLGRYQYAHDTSTKERQHDTYKPFLHVFDAEGKAPITKGPGGEFTHHRGLFIGWSVIEVNGKKYDRWHMKGGDQVHQKFAVQSATGDKAEFVSVVHWMDEAQKPILEENRTITFLPAPAPAYACIEMKSKLKAVAGATVLGGDPEHAGLQFRPANEVDRTATVYTYPVAGADPHKDRDYPWVAETFSLNGKKFSVIFLNHPDNPKNTPFSAYRNYGRFGGFFKTAIPADGETTIQARLLVAEGEMPPVDFIQKACNDYTGKKDAPPAATVKPAEGAKPAPAPKNPPAKS